MEKMEQEGLYGPLMIDKHRQTGALIVQSVIGMNHPAASLIQ